MHTGGQHGLHPYSGKVGSVAEGRAKLHRGMLLVPLSSLKISQLKEETARRFANLVRGSS